MLTQSSPRVIVNNYGYYYPRGSYFFNGKINNPLRTEVLSYPDTFLVTLDEARDWVGLSGDNDSDAELTSLLQAFSDHICGPNSMTNKCFRKWEFADIFEVYSLTRYSRIYLSYPITQSIEQVYFTDILGNRSVIDQSKYRFIKRDLKKSYIVLFEDMNFVNENNEESVELGVNYNCSSSLDSDNTPIIDKRLIQAVKYYINDAFYKRGIQLGPFEGAGVENKLVRNLIKSFMY